MNIPSHAFAIDAKKTVRAMPTPRNLAPMLSAAENVEDNCLIKASSGSAQNSTETIDAIGLGLVRKIGNCHDPNCIRMVLWGCVG
ncbi:MAG: hypothetical protein QGG09_04955, partial [Pirellulaceae bacterium]|nr:hypothetical protein [Pirellulaceae bacterium]